MKGEAPWHGVLEQSICVIDSDNLHCAKIIMDPFACASVPYGRLSDGKLLFKTFKNCPT